jgi:hypothetical protein
MTYEVQVQSLTVKRYTIEASSPGEIRSLFGRKGSRGIVEKADHVAGGDETEDLISIAEAE